MRRGYNGMKKEIYYTPDIDVLMMDWEDVICNSADTDIPFDFDETGDDIFNT